jgi:hypothetical protein
MSRVIAAVLRVIATLLRAGATARYDRPQGAMLNFPLEIAGPTIAL